MMAISLIHVDYFRHEKIDKRVGAETASVYSDRRRKALQEAEASNPASALRRG